jgi:hypothetical protein
MIRRAMLALLVMSGAARADLLPDGMAWRELPFTLIDGKPMLEVQVGGQTGVMMFDNGTPASVFLNREAADLAPGQEVGRGTAASGQEILVQVHPAPAVQVVGLPMATENPARSGNFGFVEGTFGADFLGFVGMPAVQDHAILLDYDRRVLTVARVASDGRMALPAPPAAEVLAEFAILLLPDELPMAVGAVGDQPVLLSLDTGDSGTAYLTPALHARLQATGALTDLADGRVRLTGVAMGGVDVGAVDMALIMAGSPQDRRGSGQPDELRLGAGFLANHPMIWNLAARRITLLRRGSPYLVPRD